MQIRGSRRASALIYIWVCVVIIGGSWDNICYRKLFCLDVQYKNSSGCARGGYYCATALFPELGVKDWFCPQGLVF